MLGIELWATSMPSRHATDQAIAYMHYQMRRIMRNLFEGFLTKSDTNWAVSPQKMDSLRLKISDLRSRRIVTSLK